MGDALSKPKGEWDDDVCYLELEDELDGEDIADIELSMKVSAKASTVGMQNIIDPYAKNAHDPFSYNGLSNTMQYLGSGYVRGGYALVEEYIREFIISEGMMSGKIAASGVGNVYPRSGVVASAGRMGIRDPGIDHGGYVKGARLPGNLGPYVASNSQATKDGHQQTRHDIYFDDEIEENEDSDLSTFELFNINVKKDKNKHM